MVQWWRIEFKNKFLSVWACEGLKMWFSDTLTRKKHEKAALNQSHWILWRLALCAFIQHILAITYKSYMINKLRMLALCAFIQWKWTRQWKTTDIRMHNNITWITWYPGELRMFEHTITWYRGEQLLSAVLSLLPRCSAAIWHVAPSSKWKTCWASFSKELLNQKNSLIKILRLWSINLVHMRRWILLIWYKLV